MPVKHLTERAIEWLPAPDPSGKQVVHWDDELKGFGVLCSGKTNAKTFIVQHKLNGKNIRISIGPVNIFTGAGGLLAARVKAKLALSEFYAGRDPKASGRKTEAATALSRLLDVTLNEALENYISACRDLRPGTIAVYRQSVRKYLSDWGDKPLRAITPDMVEERHAAIQAAVEKRRRQSSQALYAGHAVSNQALKSVRMIWHYHSQVVEDEARRILGPDYCSAVYPPNPVSSSRMKRRWFPSHRRERVVKPEELPAFYRAISELPNLIQAAYLKCLLFTGMRRTEASMIQWQHVDFRKRVITVPPENNKSKRLFLLPLTDPVYAILIALQERGRENEFVFPSQSKSGHLEEPKMPLDAVAVKCGIRVSAHDLRRTFASISESLDIGHFALKRLLNHAPVSGDVTARYVVLSDERLREAAQKIARHIAALCEPKIKPATKTEAKPTIKRERLDRATRTAA